MRSSLYNIETYIPDIFNFTDMYVPIKLIEKKLLEYKSKYEYQENFNVKEIIDVKSNVIYFTDIQKQFIEMNIGELMVKTVALMNYTHGDNYLFHISEIGAVSGYFSFFVDKLIESESFDLIYDNALKVIDFIIESKKVFILNLSDLNKKVKILKTALLYYYSSKIFGDNNSSEAKSFLDSIANDSFEIIILNKKIEIVNPGNEKVVIVGIDRVGYVYVNE